MLDGMHGVNEGKVEEESSVVRRVRVGKGSVVFGRSMVRGQFVIGENCRTGPNAYIGPYTAVGDRCRVSKVELDDSIVMDDNTIEVEMKLVRAVDTDTYCVCLFGGDLTPQLQFALRACDMCLNRPEITPRICWETDGSMSLLLPARLRMSRYGPAAPWNSI